MDAASATRPQVAIIVSLAVLLPLVVWLQVVRDSISPPVRPGGAEFLYIPSASWIRRFALSHDALMADIYWVRAVQHYGSTRRSTDPRKRYDLLYPLLDITTTLDPRFNIAYRFGQIFLAEPFPAGPGRPDLAIALLEKGLRVMPDKWQYMQDIGFVYYWWQHDYTSAASWFRRASEVPGAPWWLGSLAAATLAQGGHRGASRVLWTQMRETAEIEWIRQDAARRLAQLDALDEIDRLRAAMVIYERRTGARPETFAPLVRAGLLRQSPIDPTGVPYTIDPATGAIDVARASRLWPLPSDSPELPVSLR